VEITVTTTAPTTTQPLTAPPIDPNRKPFSEDDLAFAEKNLKSVGNYVKLIPAPWYHAGYFYETDLRFYDHKPEDNWYDPIVNFAIYSDIPGFTDANEAGESVYLTSLNYLPKELLAAPVDRIDSIDFSKTGTAIPPPRGIKIGDPASKIFENFPGDRNYPLLYEMKTLVPYTGEIAQYGQVIDEVEGYRVELIIRYPDERKTLTYIIDGYDVISGIDYRYYYPRD